MKQKARFFQSGLALLIFMGSVSLATAQEHEMDHGAMGHGEMNHSAPGGEYRTDEPMDHGDHGGMQHGDGLFRTRGSHDQPGLSKPENMDSLQARGRNIYLHMCVFCHGEDGNGGGKAVEYLYPWPRDFREGLPERSRD